MPRRSAGDRQGWLLQARGWRLYSSYLHDRIPHSGHGGRTCYPCGTGVAGRRRQVKTGE